MATLKFKCTDWRDRKQQEFNKEKIFIEKAGEKINLYDFIQTGRDDTEIIPTLLKYGCLEGHIAVDNSKMFGDFSQLTDLRGVLDAKNKAEDMFYSLPLDVRKEFNNNINDFTKNGAKYFAKKMEEEQAKLKAETVQEPVQTEMNMETNNG